MKVHDSTLLLITQSSLLNNRCFILLDIVNIVNVGMGNQQSDNANCGIRSPSPRPQRSPSKSPEQRMVKYAENVNKYFLLMLQIHLRYDANCNKFPKFNGLKPDILETQKMFRENRDLENVEHRVSKIQATILELLYYLRHGSRYYVYNEELEDYLKHTPNDFLNMTMCLSKYITLYKKNKTKEINKDLMIDNLKKENEELRGLLNKKDYLKPPQNESQSNVNVTPSAPPPPLDIK